MQHYELRDHIFKLWEWNLFHFGAYDVVDTTYEAQSLDATDSIFGFSV